MTMLYNSIMLNADHSCLLQNDYPSLCPDSRDESLHRLHISCFQYPTVCLYLAHLDCSCWTYSI